VEKLQEITTAIVDGDQHVSDARFAPRNTGSALKSRRDDPA